MNSTEKKWFSIILAMWIVLLLSLIWLYLMEYMIPFSRNVKWIENASQAYYESYAWVEESAFKIYNGDLWLGHNNTFDSGIVQDFGYNFVWSWARIPAPWQWNAPDNPNYSRLSQNEPISLQIWNWKFSTNTDNIIFRFEIPELNWSTPSFDSPNNDIILWQLSWSAWSLTSEDLIQENQENTNINLWPLFWIQLDGTRTRFRDFYRNILNCDDIANDCILRISVINPLVTSTNSTIPYLEYQINASRAIPYQNPVVSSQGKSFGFSKTLEVFIPQKATSSAFDFTVLQ